MGKQECPNIQYLDWVDFKGFVNKDLKVDFLKEPQVCLGMGDYAQLHLHPSA